MHRITVALFVVVVVGAGPVRAAERCSLQAAPSLTLEVAIEELAPTRNAAMGSSSTGTTGVGLPGSASFESMLIDGLTTFVVKRARQEAIAFVLDQIEDKVCKHATVLFPLTCGLFRAANDTNTAVIPGRGLQDALVADLRAIPWHVADAIDGNAASSASAKKVAALLRAADDIACGIEHHQSPLLLVAAAIARYEADLGFDKKTSAVLQIVARLVANVSAKDIEVWLDNPDRLVEVVGTTLRGAVITFAKDALARASAEAAKLLPTEGLLVREAFDIIVSGLPLIREAGTLEEAVVQLRKRLAELKSRAASLTGVARVEINAVIASLADLAEHIVGAIEDPAASSSHVVQIVVIARQLATQLQALAAIASAQAGPEWQNLAAFANKLATPPIVGALQGSKWTEVLAKAKDAYDAYVEPVVPHALAVYAAVRSYRTASTAEAKKTSLRTVLESGLGLVEQLVVPAMKDACDNGGQPIPNCKYPEIASAAIATARAFLAGDYTLALRNVFELLALTGDVGNPAALTEVKRFGALFAEIASATSGDEIAASLESAAAPLGSWRLRRKKTTYGLSARVGIAGGYEHLSQYNPDGNDGGSFGLHIPILLDVWIPFTCPIGFGLQLLDLGSITSIGIDSDTDVRPDANFSDVISPGVQVSLGLGKSPFVLALSASWTPSLREKTTIDPTTMMDKTLTFDSWRYMLSFGVDVPIFMW